MLCVTIGRTRHKMMMVEIQEAAKQGAEMIELRLDFLSKAPDFKRLLALRSCPMLATIRRAPDGGRWTGSEEQRQLILRQAIVAGFDWVDLETDVADTIPRFRTVKRVISYHNIHDVPRDLEQIYARMSKQDPDVVKIAVRANSFSDNLRVLNLMRSARKPTIAICMGDLGVPSRILAAKFGAPFSYAAFNKERGVAPGILSYQEMKETYGYNQLNSETRVFGVIGDPVTHSLSPLIHNAAFHALNMNCVYVPFRIPREELGPALKDFHDLPAEGLSVTIPHKESAATLATEFDEEVKLTHSANTLIRRDKGFAAFNTDAPAAIESLRSVLSQTEAGPSLMKRPVLVLGAGGVGRAIVHALHREGALITVANRTLKRAALLAEELGCRVIDWTARHTVMCDVVINCTSVGMSPNVDESPLHQSFLRPGLVVFDTVYTPEQTLLVKEARNRAAIVLTGVDMFIRQASLQFKLFTGQEPPLDLMKKLVRRALSPIKIRDDAELQE